MSDATIASIDRTRAARRSRSAVATRLLGLLVVVLLVVALVVGRTIVPIDEVVRVLLGEHVPGASFDIGVQRLPRTLIGLAAGMAFGVAGATFQSMLGNPLASPDFIGITSGASAAAVLGLLVLDLDGVAVTALALVAGIATALLVTLLARRGESAGMRFILIGIGIGAALDALVSFVLLRAESHDVLTAMRWLAGSLSTPLWSDVALIGVGVVVLLPVLLWLSRSLGVLELGSATATGLGVRVGALRIGLAVTAVALTAVATAVTGPIAFVAFLSGPIAIWLGARRNLLAAGLVGAAIVLIADLIGQLAFATTFPVGVVTGVAGVPFLILQLIRINRQGARS